MKALMARVNQFIEQEEDEAQARESFGLWPEDNPSKKDKKLSRRETADRNKTQSSSAVAPVPALRDGKKSKPVVASYKAVNTIFREPIYKILSKIKLQPFFKWPQLMKGDPSTRYQNKLCGYHKQNGHKIEDCKAFKAHLEKLVKDEHLRDYIKKEGGDNSRAQRRNDDDKDSDVPESIINVIHLTFAP